MSDQALPPDYSATCQLLFLVPQGAGSQAPPYREKKAQDHATEPHQSLRLAQDQATEPHQSQIFPQDQRKNPINARPPWKALPSPPNSV